MLLDFIIRDGNRPGQGRIIYVAPMERFIGNELELLTLGGPP
ncbi:hypothetical protein [Corynebacterium sp. A21]